MKLIIGNPNEVVRVWNNSVAQTEWIGDPRNPKGENQGIGILNVRV